MPGLRPTESDPRGKKIGFGSNPKKNTGSGFQLKKQPPLFSLSIFNVIEIYDPGLLS